MIFNILKRWSLEITSVISGIICIARLVIKMDSNNLASALFVTEEIIDKEVSNYDYMCISLIE